MASMIEPGATGLPPVFLQAPEVRYAPVHPDGRREGAPRRMEGAWSRAPGGDWVCADPFVGVRVGLRAAGPSVDGVWVEAGVVAHRPLQVRYCAIALAFPALHRPRCLDARLRWHPLHEPVTTNEVTPSVLRWQVGDAVWELRTARGCVACRFAWQKQLLHVTIVVDAAALHPRWSFGGGRRRSRAAPEWAVCQEVTQALLLRRVHAAVEERPVTAGRFPAGAEAAFCMTGHCDFDQTPSVRTFLDGDGRGAGWLGRGLRCTKGVFTLPSTPPGRPPAPSIADPEYRRLIHRLHDDGSEIAPHALNESGQLTFDEFRSALARVVEEFSPRTWIDHALQLEYCYYAQGATSYRLLDELRSHGFTTLWAYHDIPFEASTSLNMLAPVSNDLRPTVRQVARHLWRREALVAAHYVRTALRSHTEGVVGEAVGGVLSATRGLYMDFHRKRPAGASLRKAARELAKVARRLREGAVEGAADPYTRRELLSLAPSVYLERALPFSQAAPDDLLLFASLEVLHVRDAYTVAALDRLTSERGLHVGHVYLMNRLPYIAGVFRAGESGPRLAPEWVAFLDALGALVRDGRVWNPVASDLAEWMRMLQLVTVTPVGERAVEIHNPLDRPVAGFTLLLPRGTAPSSVQWMQGRPVGHRRWHDCLAVWGEVPACSRVGVRWEGVGEGDASGRERGIQLLPLAAPRPAARRRQA